MTVRICPVACMLILSLSVPVPDVVADTTAGMKMAPQQISGQQQHNRRGPKKFILANGEGAVIQLWNPDLSSQLLTAGHDSFTLPRTGVDNYHAVVVEKDRDHLKEAIIRYEYMHGKPSGHSTSELTAAQKSAFEIVPDPVPREHQHYRSDQSWDFLLRFKGRPVAEVPVTLETSHGTITNAISDSEGRFSLRVPDDFPDIKEGERDRRKAEFTISAEIKDAGVTYQTALSAEYRVNSSHWQSLGMGTVIVGVGMLAGAFLGRVGMTSAKRGGR